MKGTVKRIGLEALGWVLLIGGVVLLIAPGPGLLAIFGGLAILSQQYEWADRRLAPVKFRALKGAAESVENWLRIALSLSGVALLVAAGVYWIISPPAPGWWPIDDRWWLPGGVATGVTQIASAAIALALMIYSFGRFYGKPDAVAELEAEIKKADEDYDEATSD